MDRDQRLQALAALAAEIEERREELVEAAVRGLARVRSEAEADVDLAIARLRAFCELLPALDGRLPLGTVAVVLPGNALLSNPAAAIGTAFLAGNRVLARFPSSSAAWARTVEPIFLRHLAGLAFGRSSGRRFLADALDDPGVQAALVFGDDAWAAPLEPRVRNGRTRFIFEGPGNDPFLVLPGADPARAARDAVRGACHCAGQACTSPERLYVHRSLAEELTARVVEEARAQVLGEPGRPEVTVGPILRRRAAERIADHLADAGARGARFRLGGKIEEGRLADGRRVAWIPPTVLSGVDASMRMMREETPGPVLAIQEVRDAAEAVAAAVDGRYGLAADLYGGDEDCAAALAAHHGLVFRDEIWLDYFGRNLHPPYGGRKASGWVWEWRRGSFVRRDGPRVNAAELSRAPEGDP